MNKRYQPTKHALIPKHIKLSEKEKKEVLDKYCASLREFPKILKKDPAIAGINAEAGDMIKITRDGPTAGESFFYRVVTDE